MRERASRAWPKLLACGAPIGFAASLAGIGGGLFASSLLFFGFGFELRRATGSALVLVLATTAAATATEVLRDEPAVRWELVACLVPGVLVGAQVGFVLSERLPERALRAVFAVCLLYSAARLATASAGGAAAGAAPVGLAELGPVHWVGAALAGLGGGLAGPLLGVGGGIVMVPALFLGLGTSFDVARACSLAAGCVGSARSLLLKSRAGRVSWPHGVPLACGTIFGAVAGVAALGEHAVLVEVGRWILAAVLAFLGLRFLHAWLRAPAPAERPPQA